MSRTAAEAAEAATRYQRTFPGRADQVRQVRHELARHLAGCPAIDDAVLIVSELAANAIVHSASQGEFFAVRCQVNPGQVRIEVEDLGGPWQPGQPDNRPHGLSLVTALAGPGHWGISGDHTGRTAWARLTW